MAPRVPVRRAMQVLKRMISLRAAMPLRIVATAAKVSVFGRINKVSIEATTRHKVGASSLQSQAASISRHKTKHAR